MRASRSGKIAGLLVLGLLLVEGGIAVGLGPARAWVVQHVKMIARQALRRPAETPPDDERAVAARRARQAPIIQAAPAPLPRELPVVGSDARDAEGYPLRAVDPVSLRSLLQSKKYADLTSHFEQLQSAFEADYREEYGPMDASDAFVSAEPELGTALDAWSAAAPSSFAPYLARGAYRAAVAFASRGEEYIQHTPRSDLAAMHEAIRRANEDLDHALALRPKLVAAYRSKIKLAKLASSSAERDAIIQRAISVCPDCFQVRATHLYSLVPLWGGSYPEMEAFARASQNPARPKMRFLQGYADLDRAQMALRKEDSKAALAAITRACALGEHWEFLVGRGKVRRAQGDLAGAIADFNRAEALRGSQPAILNERAWAFHMQKNWEPAGRDLLRLLRADPTSASGRRLFDSVVKGLIYEGWEHHKAGRRFDALRVFDLTAELDPTNRELTQRRAWAVLGNATGTNELSALEKAVADNPDASEPTNNSTTPMPSRARATPRSSPCGTNTWRAIRPTAQPTSSAAAPTFTSETAPKLSPTPRAPASSASPRAARAPNNSAAGRPTVRLSSRTSTARASARRFPLLGSPPALRRALRVPPA